MNVNKLKGKMVEKQFNVDRLAAAIGVDRSSLYRKLNNMDKMTIGETQKISAALSLTVDEASEIFLA